MIPGHVEKRAAALAGIDNFLTGGIKESQTFDIACIGIGRVGIDDAAGKSISPFAQDVCDVRKR